MKKIIEIILCIIISLLLSLAFVQKQYGLFKVRSLDGEFVPAPRPEFTWKTWNSAEYQSAFNKFVEENIGFRDILIRITNQVDFSLFRKVHAEGVVLGKDDYLYEYDYIRAYLGIDYVGEYTIDKKLRRLKFVQEYLKKEKGIHLVLVFEPSKVNVYPEFVPREYDFSKRTATNYESYTRRAKELGVEYIDFNAWFKTLALNEEYPVYPRYGTHWSAYGMSKAADSMVNYLEHILGKDLPGFTIDSLVKSDTSDHADYDVGRTLNLLWRLPEKEKLAYPVFSFENDTSKFRPMVLVVGDSYYWNIFNTRLPLHLYRNEAFWYFNSEVFPDSYNKKKSTKELDLRTEIEKQDVIFLMVTDRFLHKFDWNLVDNIYRLYAPYSGYDLMYDYSETIRQYHVWFSDMIAKAKDEKISLEQMIQKNASYTWYTSDLHKYLVRYGPQYYADQIRQSPEWLESVKKQAAERKISLDEMICLNAVNTIENENKESYELYKKLQEIMKQIRANPVQDAQVKAEAAKYYLTYDEMLLIEAERRLKGQ